MNSERFAERRSQYKKAIGDDSRRWRSEFVTQIRKDKHNEALAKKRQAFSVGDVPTTAKSMDAAGQSIDDSAAVQACATPTEIQQLVQQMKTGTEQESYGACEMLRKLLSLEKDPPINMVIQCGAVPVFMQILNSELSISLQFEAAWCLTNIASGSSDQTRPVIDAGGIETFCKWLHSDSRDMREQAVWALGNLAGDNIESRDKILELDALNQIRKLIHAEQLNFQNPQRVPFLVNCTWTISNLVRGKPCPDLETCSVVSQLLHKLIYVDNRDLLSDVCWAISYITDASDNIRPGAIPDENLTHRINDILYMGLGFRIVELMKDGDPHILVPALRCAGNIVTGTDDQTQTMILCGVIQPLGKLLVHSSPLIQKEAAWTISNITAGNRVQIQEVISHGLIDQLVERLTNADWGVKMEAIWSISNALSGGNSHQVAEIVNSGCIPPMVAALGDQDERHIRIVLDALEAILNSGAKDRHQKQLDDNPYAVLMEQAGALDHLEFMLGLEKSSILRQKAEKIVSEHFEMEEDANNDAMDANEAGNWAFD